MEKRLPIAIVVHLVKIQEQSANGIELTYTDNISAHGACVVSSHPWQPGEVAEVTSLKDHTTLRGRVIHCQKRGDERFGVGMTFQDRQIDWSIYNTYIARL
ncbi:MAG TPA: PilZ domain-containing protein [Candidatus Acidoferrum sp.]|nr:PilZ domain-containing protein [Candidatus Acidoferrum sp.]